MKYQKKYQYQEISVDTIEEIYQIIDEFNNFHKLPRTVYKDEPQLQAFFRGQSDSRWDISPSILRTENPKAKEPQIVQEFHPPEDMSLFGTIAYIQHYRIGTRFIDFTTNPDIAIYFACEGACDADGAVFLYPYAPHKAEWYTAMILCELARLETERNKITIYDFTEQVLAQYPDLKKRFPERNELEGTIVSFLDRGFMVLPDNESVCINLRMQRQNGCFFICGVKFEPELTSSDRWFSRAGRTQFSPRSAVVPDDLQEGCTLVKIIIPKHIKQKILHDLAEKGITRSFLLPE